MNLYGVGKISTGKVNNLLDFNNKI